MTRVCGWRPYLARETMTRTHAKGGAAGARMPAIFAAHGAPILLDDATWMHELAAVVQRPLSAVAVLPRLPRPPEKILEADVDPQHAHDALLGRVFERR